MSSLGVTLKMNEIDERDADGNFSPVPPGLYCVRVAKAEAKETKARTGRYLNLSLYVTRGNYKGRTIYESITYQHPNETAARIGRARVKKLCVVSHARVDSLNDTRDLLTNNEFVVEVDIRPAQNGYKAANEVKKYYDLSEVDLGVDERSEAPGSFNAEPTSLDDDDIPF